MDTKSITIRELRSSRSSCRMFSVRFFGKPLITTVTSSPSVVRKWISSTRYFYGRFYRRLVVGLGVQWTPRTTSYTTADLLQLCVGKRCLIFQLKHANSIPILLRRFLADLKNRFVGVRNYCDEGSLRRSKHNLVVWKVFELGNVAAGRLDRKDLHGASMETLVGTILGHKGVKKDQSVGMSNWGSYSLGLDQVLYAAVDAYVSFQIGKELGVGHGGFN